MNSPGQSFKAQFSKAQVAALAATVADFGTLTLWTEVLKGFYGAGVALGAASGAIVNFFLNRHWSFRATHQKVHTQMLRYALVSAGSLLLNTFGVVFVTEKFGVHYLISKIIVSLSVGFFYNYPLHRYFVYPAAK